MHSKTFYIFFQCGVKLIFLIFCCLWIILIFCFIKNWPYDLFFLLSTLLYLCQNWFSSCASFTKLVMFLCLFISDLLIIFWYLALADCRSERFEHDHLILNLLLASFNSFPACFISLLHQPFLIFFDASVIQKYSKPLVTMMLAYKFVCFSILSSVITSGKLTM